MSLDSQKGDPEKSVDDRLAGIERSLEHLKRGLGLLGLKSCGWCGIYYRHSDKGALFHHDEFVCFKCIPDWWSQRCPELSGSERQKAERALRQWLVSHHHAEVILRPGDLPKPEQLLMKLVTGCEECAGGGKTHTGGRCHHCDGRGTVWVIVRAPNFGPSSE